MKNVFKKPCILLFAGVLLIIGNSEAQSSKDSLSVSEWPPLGAEWYYSSYDAFDYFHIGYKHYYVSKIDTINNRICSLIDSTILYTQNRIVYTYNSESTCWDTLLNFNAVPGEGWSIHIQKYWDYGMDISYSFFATVIDTSTIVINGFSLRRLILNYEFPDWEDDSEPYSWGGGAYSYKIFVEGIGSAWNMFPQYAFIDPCFCGELRCYTDTIIGHIETGSVDYCTQIIISAQELEKDKIKIYPVPATESITVEAKGIMDVEMFLPLGAKIQFQDSKPHDNTLTINVKDLLPGIYFIKVTLPDKKYIRKVIIE